MMTAFLSGEAIGRTVFIRGPSDGLPAVNGKPAVKPYQLMQVLKGAYGLSEAPRLWYLRDRELLVEVGFVELCCARAVFILQDKRRTVAMLTLHVDDGLLAGDQENKVYKKAVQSINSKFNIKEWNNLEQGAVADYLGMQWQQDEEGVTLNMDKYMKGIMEMEGKTKGKQADLEEKLEDDGVHNFRSSWQRCGGR